MNVLITGGTGSLGSLLVDHFIERGDNVSIVSRDGHKQAALLQKHPQVKAYLGDICDRDLMQRVTRNQEVVINAAALKRIERGQTDPMEYVRVNILGAENVIRCASDNSVEKCLLISSDKGPMSSSVYGSTKYLAEAIYTSYPIGACLRYGNVMDSNGSVWWAWLDALQHERFLNLRMPNPTRFFLLRIHAIKLIQDALDHMCGGEVFVPRDLASVSLESIARVLDPEARWLTSPLLPGEKQHEVLIGASEYYKESIGDLLVSVGSGVSQRNGKEMSYCSENARRISGIDAVALLLDATQTTLPSNIYRG